MPELDDIPSGDVGNPVNDAVAELERQLESERDKRREDWFFMALVGVILFDAWLFRGFDTWSAPFSILSLEVLLLLGLGERLGVEYAQLFIDRVLTLFDKTNAD